jgi:hypothetical protein
MRADAWQLLVASEALILFVSRGIFFRRNRLIMSGMTSVALKKPNTISRTKWGDLCRKLHCLSALFAFGRARLLGLKHGDPLDVGFCPAV